MNFVRLSTLSLGLSLALTAPLLAGETKSLALPENLAARARITASSEYSRNYQAKFVADGIIPDVGGKQDLGHAWCVNGSTHRSGAEIAFAWDQPVTVAEVVYYGRTAWFVEECWKGYELFVDDGNKPAATGRLEMLHGPQRVKLPAPMTVRQLRLKFTSSYGGSNPGASEIQVFVTSPPDAALHRLVNTSRPPMDEADPAALRAFIRELQQTHGAKYAAAEHLAQLTHLENERRPGTDIAGELARLQRDVLLFDATRLLVIQRHEIESSHVYTYHKIGTSPCQPASPVFRSLYSLKTLDEALDFIRILPITPPGYSWLIGAAVRPSSDSNPARTTRTRRAPARRR